MSLVRQPGAQRLLIVIGLGAVACAILPIVVSAAMIPTGARYEVLGWSTRIAQLTVVGVVVATLLLLRHREFATLRRARNEYAAKHPNAVVETVSFDPLWIPVDAAHPRNPSQRTYGLVAADVDGLTAIEEGTVILAVRWDELTEFGPGPTISFTHGDERWSITPQRRNAHSRLTRR